MSTQAQDNSVQNGSVQNNENQTPATKIKLRPGKFNGNGAGWAQSAFYLFRAFPALKSYGGVWCHLVSADIQADVIRLGMSDKDKDHSFKVSKLGKDGERAFAGKSKTNKGASSPAMDLLFVCQTLDGLYNVDGAKECIKRFFPPLDALNPVIQEYIERKLAQCEKYEEVTEEAP